MIMKAKNNPLKLIKVLAQPLLFYWVNPVRKGGAWTPPSIRS